jgi:DNA-binding CsgD family transcriptional regulator
MQKLPSPLASGDCRLTAGSGYREWWGRLSRQRTVGVNAVSSRVWRVSKTTARRRLRFDQGGKGLLNDCPSAVTSLLRTIATASVHVEQWPVALEQLCSHLGAQVVTLGHHEFTTGSDSAMVESTGSAGFSQEMTAFSARNPWFLSSGEYVVGRVLSGEELISNGDLRRTDFYRGFLQPRQLLHRLCGVVAQGDRGACLVSAYRAEEQDPFGQHERAELTALLGHITLALEGHWRWQEADDLARALLGLNDQDANPIFMLTGDAEPIYRNPAAGFLLDGGVGLCMEGSRLVAVSPADRRLLRETIALVAKADSSHASPSVLTLACSPPTPPIVVILRAAGQMFVRTVGRRQGLVAITVRGGHALHDPASCAFARQYELTTAQARVSSLVFSGQPLSTIARSLNVSENTVRSHLKQIFQKTDTHGQMDLVHLHARMCSTLS